MPAPEVHDLTERAVLWPLSRRNGANEPILGEPVNVLCRWEWTHRQTLSPQGTPLVISASVKLSRDCPPGSVLWLAPDQTAEADEALEQFYETGSAGTDVGLMAVETRRINKDLKGLDAAYVFGLSHYRSSLPTVES